MSVLKKAGFMVLVFLGFWLVISNWLDKRNAQNLIEEFVISANNKGFETKIISYTDYIANPISWFFPQSYLVVGRHNHYFYDVYIELGVDEDGEVYYLHYLQESNCNEGQYRFIDEYVYNNHIKDNSLSSIGFTRPEWKNATVFDLSSVLKQQPWIQNVDSYRLFYACSWDDLL